MEGLIELIRGGTGADDALVLDRLGALVAEAQTLAVLGLRSTVHAIAATEAGAGGSVRKLVRAESFWVELLGPAGAALEDQTRSWIEGYLMKRCLTIAGGTSEIQRNILAERALGLPRDDAE